MANEVIGAPGAALLAALSRELREPLRSATGWVALLTAAGHDPEIVADAVRGLELSLRRQFALADDLSEVSELAAGRLAMTWATFDVVEALHDAIANGRWPGLDVIAHDGGAPLLIAGDRRRFQQVIERLLTHVLAGTAERQPARLDVHGVNGRCEIDLSLADIAIASDEPQVNGGETPPECQRGTVGLVLARQLIHAHGGVLECIDDVHGRAFRIQLPRVQARGERRPPRRRADRVLEDLAILVVDDDDTAREALAEALSHLGATVTTAPSVARALEQLHGTHFDAVCSDIEMPGDSGMVLARTRRAEESGGRRQPLVAVSGLVGPGQEATARQAGFDACISKPVDVALLASRLRTLVDAADADQLERNSPTVASEGT